MSTENGKMFRSSISGYNKEDVNRYILEMDRKNKDKTDALETELVELKKTNGSLSEAVEAVKKEKEAQTARLLELEAEIGRLKEENNAQAEAMQDLTKRHDFYRIQTEAQNEALTKAKDEKTALSDRIKALTDEIGSKDSQIKANAEKYATDIETLRSAYESEIKQIKDASRVDEGVAYKLDMYDRISSQIGDILINANRNSDEIITAARTEADKLLTETNAKASENSRKMRDGIHSCADATLDGLKNDFSANVSSCIGELQTCMKDIQYEANALMAFLTRKHEEMTERIDLCHNSISDSIDSRLGAMESKCGTIINSECENI